MSTTVTYKGSIITTVNNTTKILNTAGRYMEDNVTLVDVTGSGSSDEPSGPTYTNIVPEQTFTPTSDYTLLTSTEALMNGEKYRYIVNSVEKTGTAIDSYGSVILGSYSDYSNGTSGAFESLNGVVYYDTKLRTEFTVQVDKIIEGSSSGSATLITKTITTNGTYNASDDSADGYSQVTVNVSSSSGPTYETIVPSQTIDCTMALSNGAYAGYITNYTETLVEGQKYRVIFDGTEYDPLNATYYGSDTDYLYIGDANVEASASATLTYPFEVMLYSNYFYLDVKGSGTHTLQVDKIISDSSSGSTNPLKGKIATFTGDSICAGAGYTGGYAKIIGEDYDMIIQNIGVSDGTMVEWQDKFCISKSIANMRSDADYVILEGGGNDADWGPQYIPVGTLSSGYDATLDTTTFAGAFETMLKSAIAKFSNAKIGYIFVHKCIPTFDAPNGAYHTMAISALEKWGIPYCDLNVMVPPLGYIDDLKTTYTRGDGVHPNEVGYRTFYAPKIAAFMQTMLTDKSLVNKTVTVNGTYSAEDDNADGYSSVTVNVASSGITPTGSINITTNGTHDVTNYASAVVNVSSGSSGLQIENIVAEQTINCTIAVGNGYGNYIQTYTATPIVETYYLVTIDGTEYIAKAFQTTSSGMICIGDVRVQQGSEYVEFPFEIIKESAAFYLIMKESGECTLKIDKILSW